MRYGFGTHKSVNDYFIHRDHFFSAGGYDEELIGIRDGDRSFFRQLLAAGGKEKLLQIDLVITRNSTDSYSINEKNKIKSPFDKKITDKLIKILTSRESNPEPKKPILTFEWEQINLGE